MTFVRCALVVLTAAIARNADACQCIEADVPPCQSFFESSAVFAGTVRSIGPNPAPRPPAELRKGPYQDLRVEFVDVEPFRGVEGSTFHVLTGGAEISCGYGFKVGERYVVYGRHTADGAVEVSICSETKLASAAADELVFLRIPGLPRSSDPVFGTIKFLASDPATDQRIQYDPVRNARIELRSAAERLEVWTDGEGRFSFSTVPLGSYVLTAVLPAGFSETSPRWHSVNLPQARACYRGDFTVERSPGR